MVPVLGNETSAARLHRKLQEMLGDVAPDFELKLKADLAAEINQLKIQKNAVILGHNYMEPALFHSVPDYVGDSLDLSRDRLRHRTTGRGGNRRDRHPAHGAGFLTWSGKESIASINTPGPTVIQAATAIIRRPMPSHRFTGSYCGGGIRTRALFTRNE